MLEKMLVVDVCARMVEDSDSKVTIKCYRADPGRAVPSEFIATV